MKQFWGKITSLEPHLTDDTFITVTIRWFHHQSRMPRECQSGLMSHPVPRSLVQVRFLVSIERPRISSFSAFPNPPSFPSRSLLPFTMPVLHSLRSCTPFATLTITLRVPWLGKHTPQLASPPAILQRRRQRVALIPLSLLLSLFLTEHRLLHSILLPLCFNLCILLLISTLAFLPLACVLSTFSNPFSLLHERHRQRTDLYLWSSLLFPSFVPRTRTVTRYFRDFDFLPSRDTPVLEFCVPLVYSGY